MRRKIALLMFAFGCAIAPVVGARAALVLSLNTGYFDLPVGGPTPITVPVSLEVTDAPIDLGAVNLGVVFSPDDPGVIFGVPQDPAASPGTVFGPTNFSVSTAVPTIDVAISDFGASDVTLGVGTHLLGELNLTVEATAPGTLFLDLNPGFTQLSNAGGVIAGVTLQQGRVPFGRVVIPEPHAGVLLVLGLLASRRGGGRLHRLRRPIDGPVR